MQILILTSKRNKQFLQDALNWMNNKPRHFSCQMFFPKNIKSLNYTLNATKPDLIVTNVTRISEILTEKKIKHKFSKKWSADV